MQNPFLVGEQIYLRALEVADAPVMTPWLNDPEVTRFMQRSHPLSVHAEEEFLRRIAANEKDVILGIALRATNDLIGSIGLHPEYRCRSARFGIAIGDRKHQGRGLGTDATRLVIRHAFDTLNMNRVWLHVYEYNPRAIHVYEKLGFKTEGRLRQEMYRDGRYWDIIVMGMLRREWEAAGSDPPRREVLS